MTTADSSDTTRPADIQFSAELEQRLADAVERLRSKVDDVYRESSEAEKLADLHYLAFELVDVQMDQIADEHPQMADGALLELRERVARRVHLLIERTRRA
ncbi:MAG: hypothetical protein AAGN46_16330 [Acidobacteriota bacterium]